jgi:lipid II:glycine glycyltransferase (peptidoglycan interpeptide bridge formation enzyme)
MAIHVVSKDEQPISSIITFTYKTTLVYKYGCSDERFHNLGGTPMLFWKAVQYGKEGGVETFDLGRSAHGDDGLVAFKEHLGAVTSQLSYYRSPVPRTQAAASRLGASWAREVVARLPDPLLVGAGHFLYRHIG